MIEYRTIFSENTVPDTFVCDRCGVSYKIEPENECELQETYSIRFVGGYSSIFGDGTKVSCDLCQCCLKACLGDFCKFDVD